MSSQAASASSDSSHERSASSNKSRPKKTRKRLASSSDEDDVSEGSIWSTSSSDASQAQKQEETLESMREEMAKRVLTHQDATDLLELILKGAHPYHRAIFLVDIGVTQKRAAKLCDISHTTVSKCLSLRREGHPIVPQRGRPRENMDEPHAIWDSIKAEEPESLSAAWARLLKVRKQLEDDSLRHASFHYYVTQFWLPFIKRFHGHNLPYTLPLAKGQYYDVDEPEADTDMVPLPMMNSSSERRIVGDPAAEEMKKQRLRHESLKAVAAVLKYEPNGKTSGLNAVSVRDAFTQKKRRRRALAAFNLAQVGPDCAAMTRQGVRSFTYESERQKEMGRKEALKDLGKARAQAAAAGAAAADAAAAAAAAAAMLTLLGSTDEEVQSSASKGSLHGSSIDSRDGSACSSIGSDECSNGSACSSIGSEEADLRAAAQNFRSNSR
jgi:predicted transcriptional regulator